MSLAVLVGSVVMFVATAELSGKCVRRRRSCSSGRNGVAMSAWVDIETELLADVAAPAVGWTGFPPMRERFFASHRVLKAKVEALVERLADAP